MISNMKKSDYKVYWGPDHPQVKVREQLAIEWKEMERKMMYSTKSKSDKDETI